MEDNVSPTLLIASPQMRDPFFEGTVVLVWHHSEEDGAIGVVINRALKHRLPEVLDLEDDTLDLSPYDDTQVVWGGPMETGSGTVITQSGLREEEDGWVLPDGLGVTRSHYALIRLLEAQAPVMLCLGYANWAPGQLDQEIEQGGWLLTDCDAAIMFETDPEDRYDRALASLGLTSTMVWMQPINE